MSEEVKEKVLYLQQQLQRDVNCLSDSNRSVRASSLNKIRKFVFVDKQLSSEEILLMLDFLLKPLLKLFPDSVEKCRETSLAIFREFYERLDCEGIGRSLTYLMPVMVSRLANQEIKEPSEEIRLQMIEFLEYFLKKLSKLVITPFYDDVIMILHFSVTDPYAEVKKISCSLIEYIAPFLSDCFFVTGECLITPILSSIGHQHSKVRTATLRALGVTMQCGGSKAGKRLEECMFPLAQRTFDQIPNVRICLYQVLGGWLLDLLDRYSYWYRLLPLFLSGLTDELPEVREKVKLLFDEIGAKYEEENERQLKDFLDYPDTTIIDTPYTRPRLGCRVLVRENFSKILPALIRDMTDWTERNRLKAAELLYTLLVHEEDHATQHTSAILQGFYKGMLVDEETVKERIDMSAEVVGYFVSSDTWIPLVTSAVIGSTGIKTQSPVATSVHSMIATLRVFSHLLKGAKSSSIQPHISEIVQCICIPDLALSETHDVILHLVHCMHNFIDKTNKEDCEFISNQLFASLLGLSAKPVLTNSLRDLIIDTQRSLAIHQEIEIQDLYRIHTKSILEQIEPTSNNWLASTSHEFLIFISILTNAGTHLGSLLPVITSILITCMTPKKDNVIKLELFNVLVELLTSDLNTSLNSQGELKQFIPELVYKVILPNCRWMIGRTAGVMRTASVSCLWALAKTGSFPAELCCDADLLAVIPTLLDDDTESTRLSTCKAFKEIISVPNVHLSTDQLHELYPHLAKRLDDNRDDVRVATCKILTRFYQLVPANYNTELYAAHLKDMYQGLLLHLDDPLQEIQEEVYAVLVTAAKICPQLLIEQLDSVRHKHRVSYYCKNLSEYVRSIIS
ncbi:Dynein assembly factor 5, axonemal [Oopsacas minuta]|uniref:Dynein assembly factor 5, axonemal n=1 Tax=Oopsacas minuta TaxID=111878 RepID=A0AAV7K3X7_9METZ|nr:Dynein assembly factor 5, axonemal [Oopsacas minuta]